MGSVLFVQETCTRLADASRRGRDRVIILIAVPHLESFKTWMLEDGSLDILAVANLVAQPAGKPRDDLIHLVYLVNEPRRITCFPVVRFVVHNDLDAQRDGMIEHTHERGMAGDEVRVADDGRVLRLATAAPKPLRMRAIRISSA